jgi:hypothetical protein
MAWMLRFAGGIAFGLGLWALMGFWLAAHAAAEQLPTKQGPLARAAERRSARAERPAGPLARMCEKRRARAGRRSAAHAQGPAAAESQKSPRASGTAPKAPG